MMPAIIDQARKWKVQTHNVSRCTPNTREIRQVTPDRYGLPALLLNGLLHFAELSAVASDQHHATVFGNLKCRGTANTGGRAGNDVRLALYRIVHGISLWHVFSFVVCLVSHPMSRKSLLLLIRHPMMAIACAGKGFRKKPSMRGERGP
jgi:hypothetical protein